MMFRDDVYASYKQSAATTRSYHLLTLFLVVSIKLATIQLEGKILPMCGMELSTAPKCISKPRESPTMSVIVSAHLTKFTEETRVDAQQFCGAAVMWKGLKHQNIVSFIGVELNPMQFVIEWMPNGTLGEYLKKNPGANRIGLVRFSPMSTVFLTPPFLPKLSDVAEGLAYLHAKKIRHGNLKGVVASSGLASTILITF